AERQAEAVRHAQEQATREAATAGAVNQALDETRRLMAQYQWPEAAASARRARELVASGAGTPDLEQRVPPYLDHTALTLRLLRSRVQEGMAEQTPLDGEVAAAFRDYGIDLAALDPDTAAARVRASMVRTQLAIALDYSAWDLGGGNRSLREKLWTIA